MRTGLYGKLPAKRDYIALGAPREFLGVWETWLQGGLAASRVRLAERWQAAYLRAPIWRFWLGQDLCGAAVIGAFMPSVDGIGRYFPLTIFARAEPEESLPPPEVDSHDEWLGKAENLLLSALGQDASFDELKAAVERFPGPGPGAGSGDVAGGFRRTRKGALIGPDGVAPGEALAPMRRLDSGRVYAGMSYWWTLGGEDFPARVIAQHRLPDAYLFTHMLTGSFDEHLE